MNMPAARHLFAETPASPEFGRVQRERERERESNLLVFSSSSPLSFC